MVDTTPVRLQGPWMGQDHPEVIGFGSRLEQPLWEAHPGSVGGPDGPTLAETLGLGLEMTPEQGRGSGHMRTRRSPKLQKRFDRALGHVIRKAMVKGGQNLAPEKKPSLRPQSDQTKRILERLEDRRIRVQDASRAQEFRP